MKALFNLFVAFSFCLILSGCGKINVSWDTDDVSSDYVSKVQKTLDDSSKEECLYLYRFYSGVSEYVKVNGEELGTTVELEALIQKVHRQNEWLDSNLESKDEDFTEALRKELLEGGFEDPKSLSDVDTLNKLVKVLDATAEGAFKAYKSK